ncbi:hypothetical protein NONI108955_02580 [Nocardia ninae]|uniref:DUF8020 domain-containing protein n=1 Tax=Nocardia ninae NBRC 108245 TaxID=1210091 RepID=A0A511MRT4_9NOCA|nr:hypothetical protein [Nocardia ninae]GEM42736.1 hypothetical protein NN4_72550 [Nocardia ninae NBRC 108245]
MRVSRIAATALLALVATVIGTSATHADPTTPDTALDVRGSFADIAYQVAASEDRRAAVTTIQDGRFDLIHDGRVVTLTGHDGNVVAALPMALRVGDKRVALHPVIEESGHRLTLVPDNMSQTPLRDVSSQERFFAEVEKAMPIVLAGAGIGAAIGFVLGFPLGLFVLDFITVPITTVLGAAIGAAAGLAMGGGQPAIDAALDYATGAP